MVKILGYGEDALTLWAVKERLDIILKEFEDYTPASDCLCFYRPSFGRSGGKGSAEFGEFDAIVASRKNIYPIESKWDNLRKNQKDKLFIRPEQLLRHEVLAWYLVNWNRNYLGQWQRFVDDHIDALKGFEKKFPTSKQRRKGLLITNLEFVLCRLLDHCKGFSSGCSFKNVLLFFYNSEVTENPPKEVNADFTLIPIDYNKKMQGNFITLYF